MDFNNINFNEITPKHGTTSRYLIDDNKKYFMKIPKDYKEYNILEREIYILSLLNKRKFEWCPLLLYSSGNKMITNYCGETVDADNLPDNYEIQVLKILDDLKKLNIKHNDIWFMGKTPELLVKNGKIYLIDFGWVSINDDFSCGINISNKKKPYVIANDYDVLEYLKKLKKNKKYDIFR